MRSRHSTAAADRAGTDPGAARADRGAASAKVDTGAGSAQSGFELHFEIPIGSPLRTLFLRHRQRRQRCAALHPGRAHRDDRRTRGTADRRRGHPRRGPPTDSGNRTLTIWGKDLSALMDRIELTGHAVSVPAAFGAGARDPRQVCGVRRSSRWSSRRSSSFRRCRSSACRSSAAPTTLRQPTGGGSRACLLPRSRAGAGNLEGLLGAGNSHRQAAAGAHHGMDALNTVDQLSFSFDREHKELPLVYVQEPFTKRTIAVPIPSISPLDPPLGADATAAAEARPSGRHRRVCPLARRCCAASPMRRRQAMRSPAAGQLDITRYGHVLRSRRLVGVRGAGLPYDGLYYVTPRHARDRARLLQASFELARNGSGLHPAHGAGMIESRTSKRFYGKYRGIVETTSIRPHAAASSVECRTCSATRFDLGRACVPLAGPLGDARWACTWCRRVRRRRVGGVRARRSRITRCGSAASGAGRTARACRRKPGKGVRIPQHRHADPRQNSLVISTAAQRRHHAADRVRRDDQHQRDRHHDPQRRRRLDRAQQAAT